MTSNLWLASSALTTTESQIQSNAMRMMMHSYLLTISEVERSKLRI